MDENRSRRSASRLIRLFCLCFAAALVAGACASDTTDEASDSTGTDSSAGEGGTETGTVDLAQGGSTLDSVKEAGVVKCGTRDALPGFAVLEADGSHQGFDADFCRVIAAAVLGDAEAVEFVDLATDDRFTALQSGQIDVLVRNTTYTASRDGAEGATFVQPNFYDGQGMMVATGSYNALEDMNGTTVCVASGTTTEGNVSAEFARLGLQVEVLSFEDTDLIQEAFVGGRCDGWSADYSQLVSLRSVYPEGPDALTILDGTFSKEPLAPAVRDGDSQWASAVNWAIYATIQAEEWGITSTNIDEFAGSANPSIVMFLGEEVDGAVLDPGLGLPTDFAYQVVSQVGNYGEIFDANLTPIGVERRLNTLWTEGGLLYSPPYR
ncbi:MAG: amino acid ABC transporter substrate-binding protein [Acidimicrobiales bacterium]